MKLTKEVIEQLPAYIRMPQSDKLKALRWLSTLQDIRTKNKDAIDLIRKYAHLIYLLKKDSHTLGIEISHTEQMLEDLLSNYTEHGDPTV